MSSWYIANNKHFINAILPVIEDYIVFQLASLKEENPKKSFSSFKLANWNTVEHLKKICQKQRNFTFLYIKRFWKRRNLVYLNTAFKKPLTIKHS